MDGETGEVLWSKRINSSEGVDEAIMSIACDNQDDIFVVGRQVVSGLGDEMLTLKLDGTDGSIIWSDHRGGNAAAKDVAWDVLLDVDDNPIVSGILIDTGDNAYFCTYKLANSDGTQLWERRVAGAQDDPENRLVWLALADNQDIVLASKMFGANGYDIYLERYANLDGVTVWNERYDGDAHGGEDIKSMCQDSEGNILISGVQDISWNYDYMVAKFSVADGSLMWISNYSGPPNWYDKATCITETSNGQIVISGHSDGSGTSWDIATVGFDANDGSWLWTDRLDQDGLSDEARHVVANSLDEVFVVGYGNSSGQGKELIVVGYELDATTDVPETPAAIVIGKAWPNPFNPLVNFEFNLPKSGSARMTIFDLRGREIAVLVDGNLNKGKHRASWNGIDNAGNAAPSGVYLAVVSSSGQKVSQKVVLAK